MQYNDNQAHSHIPQENGITTKFGDYVPHQSVGK